MIYLIGEVEGQKALVATNSQEMADYIQKELDLQPVNRLKYWLFKIFGKAKQRS